MNMPDSTWKLCSTCKKPISLGAAYYRCSVSSCNGLRTGYVFCSVPCWDAHVPGARHRDAAAMEERAPKKGGGSASEATPGRRRIVQSSGPAKAPSIPRETLVVASKLKDYIRARSGFNTSSDVLPVLSDWLRRQCDEAIDQARAEGRKTVLDRDFKN